MKPFITISEDGNALLANWEVIKEHFPDRFSEIRSNAPSGRQGRYAIDICAELQPEVYKQITNWMISKSKLKEDKW